MRSGKEWGSLMHFMDPDELDGLHVIGRNDVTLGVVDGTYAGRAASSGGHARGVGRIRLHRYAVSSANRMS
jgi:hypothetical protein